MTSKIKTKKKQELRKNEEVGETSINLQSITILNIHIT